MKNRRRVAGILICLGASLGLGFLFRGFVLEYFVGPLALLLWLLWRVAQSVPQAFYWGGLVLAAGLLAAYRLGPTLLGEPEMADPPAPDFIPRGVAYWQTVFLTPGAGRQPTASLRRDLLHVLVAAYATQQPEAPLYDIGTPERLLIARRDLPALLQALALHNLENSARMSHI